MKLHIHCTDEGHKATISTSTLMITVPPLHMKLMGMARLTRDHTHVLADFHVKRLHRRLLKAMVTCTI